MAETKNPLAEREIRRIEVDGKTVIVEAVKRPAGDREREARFAKRQAATPTQFKVEVRKRLPDDPPVTVSVVDALPWDLS